MLFDEISGRLQASTIVSIMTLTLIDAPHGPNLVATIGEIHGTGTILFPILLLMTYLIDMPS